MQFFYMMLDKSYTSDALIKKNQYSIAPHCIYLYGWGKKNLYIKKIDFFI